jgi:serine/threonine-protein kinase
MSATRPPTTLPPTGAGTTSDAPIRARGLKLPPPEPPKFSLTLKIFLAAALLILLALGGAIAISTMQARQIADRKIEADLKKAGPSWEAFQETRYTDLQRALAVVVTNPGIISLFAEGDVATIHNTLKTEQASNAKASFLLAADPQGLAFARTDRAPDWQGADLSKVPTIAGAAQGEQTRGIWLQGQKLFHVVAAPVQQEGVRTLAVIAAGFAIDDEVARNLKSLINAEVVFLADAAKPAEAAKPVLAGSTMEGRGADFLRALEARPDVVAAVLREGKTVGPVPVEIGGETYLSYDLPIRSASDQLVGSVVALRSRNQELAAFRKIQQTLLWIGLAALAVAFPLSFFLARRITGPVNRLVRATEAVRVGDLESAQLPVESKDEIGILARSFRAMIGELKEKEALEQYVASLTMNVGEEQRAATLAGKTLAAPTTGAPMRAEPHVGELFASRYEIQALLGKGGMGIVYRALDRDLDELVAIKTLRGEALTADPSLLDRFKQEIKLARRITHPNILRTHDLGEANGVRYLSMEFVKGITLKHLIDSGQLLPVPVALRIAKQMCAGLAAAHEVGVIHRDIKPQNVLIEPTGGLKIMDFGIARLTQERGMTATGTVVGTPDYMSPEQARGLPLDFRSDIYSLGVVLYEIFTGSLPFEGDSPVAVVLKHVQEKPKAPQLVNPKLDPRIAAIVLRCMEKDAGGRYQGVNDLYEALSRVTA